MLKRLMRVSLWVMAKSLRQLTLEVWSAKVFQANGSGLDITVHDIKHVPELWVSLFSINKGLEERN